MAIFLKSKNRPQDCQICSQKAISVCNYSSDTFVGCGRPFCNYHGVCPPVQDASLLSKPIPEQVKEEDELFRQGLASDLGESMVWFRSCNACSTKKVPLLSWRARRALLFLVLIFIGLAGIYLFERIEAPGPDLLSAQGSSFKKLIRFTEEEHLLWFKFRNPTCIKIIHTKSEFDSFFSFMCQCDSQAGKAQVQIVDGQIKARVHVCEKLPCRPTGSSFIGVQGQCFEDQPQLYFSKLNNTYISGYMKDNEPALCPPYTRYSEDRDACMYSPCRLPSFKITAFNATCEQCPLFTYVKRNGDFCSFGNFLSNPRFYRSPSRLSSPCPLKQKGEQLIQAQWGYSPGLVDSFGYYWCPQFDRGFKKTSRVCKWQEMTLRYNLGCSSPCKPCKEKWDFASKKCVPSETECAVFGLSLFSSGECYRTGQAPPEEFLCS